MQLFSDMKDKTVPKLRQDWFLAEVVRLKLDKPVAQLVEKTGFSKGQISKMLNKKQHPTPEFLVKFCESFEIDPKKLENYIEDHIDKESPAEQISTPTGDLKDIVLLMANNVNTLYATVKEDREAVKERLDVVETNFGTLYTNVESLLGWKNKVDRTLEVIRDQLKPLTLERQKKLVAAKGKKTDN